MGQLALRFILKSGAFINSGPMPEAEAREKVRLLITGEYKLRNILRYGDHTHPGGAWMVDLDNVAAVHTLEPQQLEPPVQPMYQQAIPTFPPLTRSGI